MFDETYTCFSPQSPQRRNVYSRGITGCCFELMVTNTCIGDKHGARGSGKCPADHISVRRKPASTTPYDSVGKYGVIPRGSEMSSEPLLILGGGSGATHRPPAASWGQQMYLLMCKVPHETVAEQCGGH